MEKKIIGCPFCQKGFKNIKYHERFCDLNPKRDTESLNNNGKNKSKKWIASMQSRKTSNGALKAKENNIPYVVSRETREKISITSKGRKHTEATKQHLSNIRKQYIINNPDKVPYKLNHYSKGRSYPEKYWKDILDQHSIKYTEQYQIGLYSLDFAIVERKIDLEIDGEQHYYDSKIVESDIRRTKFLEENGWRVLRVRWSEYQKLNLDERYEFVSSLILHL